MSTKTFTVVHSDVTITYNEKENKWQFTLRGRDRSADSLAKAREFIDKPLPAEKAKPFQKISAWFFEYTYPPRKIEVTGIAEGRIVYGGDAYVWIMDKRKRSKESVKFKIYPSTTLNDVFIAAILEKRAAIDKLKEECEDLKQRLQPLVLPKDE